MRNSRLKRLMEDETYRWLTLERISKTINVKNVSDEHVEDVVRADRGHHDLHDFAFAQFQLHPQCIDRAVWKGLLKVILAIIHGLEAAVAASNGGIAHNAGLGTSSAFRALEIAHTHFWTRDSENELTSSDRNVNSNNASEGGGTDRASVFSSTTITSAVSRL
jgi:hypothetical protein